MPRYRCRPEDFEVEEQLAYRPSGAGDHTYLWVEKRERTTEQVAAQIARAVRCSPSEVGYAGRKDRHAVARQWFSAPGVEADALQGVTLDGAVVLDVQRHPHRLRTGKLRANRFRLVVRAVDVASAPQLERRLAALRRWGFANRYGAQRFGAEGDNAERGRELLARGVRPRQRRAARFLVSALQAAVFNRLLERRRELLGEAGDDRLDHAGARPIDRLVAGDLAVKTDSGGVFEVLDPAAEQPRADRGEISPSGILFGRKARFAGGAAGELERAVLEESGVERAPRLPGLRLDGARRALRAHPTDLAWSLRGEELTMLFELGSGSYATVLLDQLFDGLGLVEAAPSRYPGEPNDGPADRNAPELDAPELGGGDRQHGRATANSRRGDLR